MSWLIPEWLLALALTLFVIDLFTDESGILSWCGVAAIAGWATWRVGASWKWSILVFIAAFFVSGGAWQWIFRGLVAQPIRRLLQRNAPDEAVVSIKGAKGTLRVIDGKVLFRWNGDELWPVANPPERAADGQEAEADGLRNGEVVLKGEPGALDAT